MAEQELVNYIKKRLSNGDDKGEITKSLAGVGWPAADIDEAFFFLKQDGEYEIEVEDGSKGSKDASHKSGKPKEILIISTSLLALAAVVYVLHMMNLF